MPMSYKAIVTP